MANKQQYQKVKKVTEKFAEKEAKKVVTCQQQVARSQETVDQLQRYHMQYHREFTEQSQHGLSATRYREYCQFMTTLSQVTQQERGKLQISQQLLQDQTQKWRQQRCQDEAVGMLIDKEQQLQNHESDKAEQMHQDEFSHRR